MDHGEWLFVLFSRSGAGRLRSRRILTKLHDMGFQPNGVVVNPMHMLENSSVVPNTVNEMLLQSHEGIIRLFPVWPRQRDARSGRCGRTALFWSARPSAAAR